MFGVFNTQERSEEGTTTRVYAKLMVEMRSHLHLFKNNKNGNPWMVFTALALHTNKHGWAWPSVDTLEEETGLSDDAISTALKHLRTIRINDKPILYHYRTKDNGQWGRSYYHVFPLSGGADQSPVANLILWDGQTELPIPEKPGVAFPTPEKPGVDTPISSKENQTPEEEEIHAPAARSAPAAQKKAGPVFRTKRQGELFHQPEKASPPQPSASEEPITEANKIIAALFGKERLSKAHSSLLDEPIVGKDSERHASLNQLQEQAPEAFQQWMDKAFPKWRAGGGKEIKHFLHSLRVQSSNTYQPQDFDSVQKDIWGE